ncbi:MAG: hypothetical protein WDM80_09105 [Limisphaerales bacterium]
MSWLMSLAAATVSAIAARPGSSTSRALAGDDSPSLPADNP